MSLLWQRRARARAHAHALLPSQAILNNDETSHRLDNLDPDTEYDVKVTAIYPDEAESEDLLGSARTCKLSLWGESDSTTVP